MSIIPSLQGLHNLKFSIQSPPFSTNSAYHKRSFTRTTECRAWGDRILGQISSSKDLQQGFKAFRKYFCPKSHGIAVELLFHIPHNIYFTKSGTLKLQKKDLSNIEKLLIDLIYDKRFNDRFVDSMPVSNLNLDDKYNISLHSAQVPSESYFIDVSLTVVNLPL